MRTLDSFGGAFDILVLLGSQGTRMVIRLDGLAWSSDSGVRARDGWKRNLLSRSTAAGDANMSAMIRWLSISRHISKYYRVPAFVSG